MYLDQLLHWIEERKPQMNYVHYGNTEPHWHIYKGQFVSAKGSTFFATALSAMAEDNEITKGN